MNVATGCSIMHTLAQHAHYDQYSHNKASLLSPNTNYSCNRLEVSSTQREDLSLTTGKSSYTSDKIKTENNCFSYNVRRIVLLSSLKQGQGHVKTYPVILGASVLLHTYVINLSSAESQKDLTVYANDW